MSIYRPTTAPSWLGTHRDWLLDRIGVDLAIVVSKRRMPQVIRARRLCAWCLYHWPGPGGITPSYPEVAYVLSRADHSSTHGWVGACEDDPALLSEARALLADALASDPNQKSRVIHAAATGRV